MNWKRLFAAVITIYLGWIVITIYKYMFATELTPIVSWALATGGAFTFLAMVKGLRSLLLGNK